MNFQLSLFGFITTVCYMIIAGFFFRFIAARFPDSAVGKFAAFVC